MVVDFPGGAEDENVPANAGDAAYRRRFPVRGPGRFHTPGNYYWVQALESESSSYWVHVLQLLKPMQLEPVLHKEATARRSPGTAERESLCVATKI